MEVSPLGMRGRDWFSDLTFFSRQIQIDWRVFSRLAFYSIFASPAVKYRAARIRNSG